MNEPKHVSYICLTEHSEDEMNAACDSFTETCIKYRNKLHEDTFKNDPPIWMHPDFLCWAALIYGLGIRRETDNAFMFYGFRLQEKELQGKGNLFSFEE